MIIGRHIDGERDGQKRVSEIRFVTAIEGGLDANNTDASADNYEYHNPEKTPKCPGKIGDERLAFGGGHTDRRLPTALAIEKIRAVRRELIGE